MKEKFWDNSYACPSSWTLDFAWSSGSMSTLFARDEQSLGVGVCWRSFSVNSTANIPSDFILSGPLHHNFLLKSVCVLVEWFVTECGPKWTWCTPFDLNWLCLCQALGLCLILCSGPSLRSCTMKLHRGRPACLRFLPFRLEFVYYVPEIRSAPKLVELINVSENWCIMVLKVWNPKECWR